MRSSKGLAAFAIFVGVLGGVLIAPAPGQITQQAYRLIQSAGVDQGRGTTINFTGNIACGPTVALVTPCNVPTATAQTHTITFVIDGAGSAIATGDLNQFPTAAFSCTINRVDISGSPSGSITVDIWKRAGAIPTAANKISASAPATLSASQLNQAGSLTGWTTAVSSGDVFGATVATAATVQKVTVQIGCS